MNYFEEIEDYPRDIADDPLPLGTLYQYVSHDFLNGFVNYVKPVKAYVLERYHAWEEVLDDDVVAHVQQPPGSFKWVTIKPRDKNHLFELLTVPGVTAHIKVDVDFQDDVVLLSKSEGGTYYVFWYDRDCSDCCIGRFRTQDTQEQVVEEFSSWALALGPYQHGNRHRELPLHYFQGWIKS